MGVQIEAGIGYPDERVWQSPPNAGGCPAPSFTPCSFHGLYLPEGTFAVS